MPRFAACAVTLLALFSAREALAHRETASALASALGVLQDTLSSGPPRLQQTAFTTLSEYYCERGGTGDGCIRLISAAARHADWQVRLMNLPNVFRPAVPQSLRQQIAERAARDSSPYMPHMRRAISKLLAEHPDHSDKSLLQELSTSSDMVVVEHAAAALVRLGEQRYAAVLEKGLGSDDREVVLEAAAHVVALERNQQARAESVLKDMLIDRDEVTRTNAIYGLSELRRVKWDAAEVERSLSDESAMVRSAMIAALPSISLPGDGQTARFEMLTKRWPREAASSMRLEILNAVAAMERSGSLSRDLIGRFIEVVLQTEPDPHVKLAAIGVVASDAARSEYRQELLAAARDAKRNLTERLVALSSLGQCGDAGLAEPLTRLMEQQGKDGNAEAVRVSCAAAIVRLHGAGSSPRPAPGGLERL